MGYYLISATRCFWMLNNEGAKKQRSGIRMLLFTHSNCSDLHSSVGLYLNITFIYWDESAHIFHFVLAIYRGFHKNREKSFHWKVNSRRKCFEKKNHMCIIFHGSKSNTLNQIQLAKYEHSPLKLSEKFHLILLEQLTRMNWMKRHLFQKRSLLITHR